MADKEIFIMDPDTLVKAALDYLERKYDIVFSPFKAFVYKDINEHMVYAGIRDDEGGFRDITKVRCVAEKNGELSISDDYMKNQAEKKYSEKLMTISEKYGKNVSVFHQSWFGSLFFGEDGGVYFNDSELLVLGGKLFGRWHIFIETEKTADDVEEMLYKFRRELMSEKLFGLYTIYWTGENALMMLDEDNYLGYISDSDVDGDICLQKSKLMIKE